MNEHQAAAELNKAVCKVAGRGDDSRWLVMYADDLFEPPVAEATHRLRCIAEWIAGRRLAAWVRGQKRVQS